MLPDPPDPHPVIQQFWRQAESAAAEIDRKADMTVKFYVVALTAFAGWLGTNHFDHASGGAMLMTLAIVGSGHVATWQFRAARLHRKARELAQAMAQAAQVPPALRLYDESDERIDLRAGQALTAAIFNVAAVVVLGGLYSALLLFVG